MSNKIQLETEVQEFAKATANPPFLADLGPEKGRAVVDEVQSRPIEKPDADIEELTIAGGPNGHVSLRIVRPPNAVGALPVIFYIHGTGWDFCNANTHDSLIRALAIGDNADVIFPHYSHSPGSKVPVPNTDLYPAHLS